jgi:regulator of protease activity HflC (stomatin/prohibitin superfamily)
MGLDRLATVKIGEVAPESPPGWCALCCVTSTFIALIILFFPCTVIQLGQHKVGLPKNRLSGIVDLDNVHMPGRYWLGFWKEFVEFPTALQTIAFADEAPETGVQHLAMLRTRDMDGKEIFLDITVQYRLYPDHIGNIYRMFTRVYEDVYISELRDSLAKAANNFPIARMWEDYSGMKTLFKEACDEVLLERHAECWGLQISGVRLNSRYEAQLIRTQVQKQKQFTEERRKVHATYRAQTNVLLAEYDKNITITEATGENQRIRVVGDADAGAEANSISAQATLLNLWRDTVVATTSSGALVQMNSTQLLKYQKHIMLGNLPSASYAYSNNGEAANMEAVNIMSVRQITDRHGGNSMTPLGAASSPVVESNAPTNPEL